MRPISHKPQESIEQLRRFLGRCKHPRSDRRVTLLPDLFVDQIIAIPANSKQFLTSARRILNRGGGNYTGVKTSLTHGGCATNCAVALSALGTPSSLVARTSKIGLELLSLTSDQRYLDSSHVRTDGNLAITAALETQNDDGSTPNLMITDTGSVGSFSSADLNEADNELFKNSFIVGIFSWNLNEKGTELMEWVSQLCSEKNVKVFADLGDPNTRIDQLPALVNRVIREGLVDYLSLNENELRSLAVSMGIARPLKKAFIELAVEVGSQLPVELDLHTSDRAGVVKGDKAHILPAFDVTLNRSTGAGDSWNAGYLFGIVNDAEPVTRIAMANLLAAAHISSSVPKPHSLQELSRYIMYVRFKRLDDLF